VHHHDSPIQRPYHRNRDKPGPGRPRGCPNKFTGDLKEAILAGVNGSNKQGVAGFVLDLSLDTPTSAAALLGRLIPVSMIGTLDGTIVVVHRDETAADSPEQPNNQTLQGEGQGEKGQ